MDDKQFEQQMKLLKKSYDRVPSKFRAEDVLDRIDDESNRQLEVSLVKSDKSSKWQKASVWAVSLASVFLIGILSASFLNDGNKQGNATGEESVETNAKDLEQLEKDYQKERDARQEMLGMTDEQFDQLGFVSLADQLFAQTVNSDSVEARFSSQSLESRYEEVIYFLRLPSEMIEEVLLKGSMDEEESMRFLDDFTAKIDNLTTVYNLTIDQHSEIIHTAKMNGELDSAYLFAHRQELPEEVENMILNSRNQAIKIDVNHDKSSYVAKFEITDMINQLYSVIHPDVSHLLVYKQLAPYTNGGELIYEPNNSARILEGIEMTLLSLKEQSGIYSSTKTYYEDLAYTMIFGSTNTHVVKNGKINEEFQLPWKFLQSIEGASPIKYFLKPVYTSVQKNDWKVNETYQAMNFMDFKEAFRLAEMGELETIMPEDYLSDSAENVKWPDADIQQKIHAYLKNSGTSNPKYALSTLSPIESVLLFSYAKQLEFPHLMKELMLPFQGMESIEDFNSFFGEENILPDGVTSLRYNDRNTTIYNGVHYGTIEVLVDNNTVKLIHLVRNQEGVWQIDQNINVMQSESIDMMMEPIDEAYIERIQKMYEEFKKSFDYELIKNEGPHAIASIYLEAHRLGDAETQYALLLNNENVLIPTREEFLKEASSQGMDWKTRFVSVEYLPEARTGEYDQVIYYNLKSELQTSEEKSKGFQLRKTSEGWRVHYMPMQ